MAGLGVCVEEMDAARDGTLCPKDLCLNLSLRALFSVCLSGEGWRVGGGGAWGQGSGGGQMKTSVLEQQ